MQNERERHQKWVAIAINIRKCKKREKGVGINGDDLNNNFFVPIPAFRFSPHFKSFFSMPLQELPLVALPCQEKTAFKISGLPLQSGAWW